jgi:hypothetical protein
MNNENEIINGFFFNLMKVGGRQCIVLMHESGLVPRADEFRELKDLMVSPSL